jgi:hypothetical protein
MDINVKEITFKYGIDSEDHWTVTDRYLKGNIKVNVSKNVGKVLYKYLQFNEEIDIPLSHLPKELREKFISLFEEVEEYIKSNVED